MTSPSTSRAASLTRGGTGTDLTSSSSLRPRADHSVHVSWWWQSCGAVSASCTVWGVNHGKADENKNGGSFFTAHGPHMNASSHHSHTRIGSDSLCTFLHLSHDTIKSIGRGRRDRVDRAGGALSAACSRTQQGMVKLTRLGLVAVAALACADLWSTRGSRSTRADGEGEERGGMSANLGLCGLRGLCGLCGLCGLRGLCGRWGGRWGGRWDGEPAIVGRDVIGAGGRRGRVGARRGARRGDRRRARRRACGGRSGRGGRGEQGDARGFDGDLARRIVELDDVPDRRRTGLGNGEDCAGVAVVRGRV